MQAALGSTSLHLSVPPANQWVECFNQMLKHLLHQVIEVEGWDWDHLLSYVLFVVRETPQASMGLTPFELLFRWCT